MFPSLCCSVCNSWSWIISQKKKKKKFPLSLPVPHKKKSFRELHWCSGLSWIAVLSGVFHNGTWSVAAWYIAPRGESALCNNLSVPRLEEEGRVTHSGRPLPLWPPPSYSKSTLNWWCVGFSLNVLSDHMQAFVVLQMLFLLWLLEEMFC